jgi:hypothetical protein
MISFMLKKLTFDKNFHSLPIIEANIIELILK